MKQPMSGALMPKRAGRRKGRGPSKPRRSATGQGAPARPAPPARSGTETIAARELRRLLPGSLGAHENLQRAVLDWCALRRIPAVPIHTGPRVSPLAGGVGFELRANAAQRGFADVLVCIPPLGWLVLVELKTGRARRSKAQAALRRRFEAAGAICLLVRDVATFAAQLNFYLERVGRDARRIAKGAPA
jgi:hypothetical protein